MGSKSRSQKQKGHTSVTKYTHAFADLWLEGNLVCDVFVLICYSATCSAIFANDDENDGENYENILNYGRWD